MGKNLFLMECLICNGENLLSKCSIAQVILKFFVLDFLEIVTINEL